MTKTSLPFIRRNFQRASRELVKVANQFQAAILVNVSVLDAGQPL